MIASTLTESQVRARFEANPENPMELLAPLMELSQESATLVPGFAVAQPRWNSVEGVIPYYHVLGRSAAGAPLRALILGGWSGGDLASSYALIRLVAVLEARFHLLDGIEATIYPILNVEAWRSGRPMTEEQVADGCALWKNSAVRHVRVVEKELEKYDYDLVIHLREVRLASQFLLEAWSENDQHGVVFEDALARYARVDDQLQWQVNPAKARFRQKVTPVPGGRPQPAEVVMGVPGTLHPEQVVAESIGLVLTLLHAARQAKAEGLL